MQRLSGRSKWRPVSALVAALAVAAMAAFGSSGATARGASGGGSKGGANVLSTTPNLSCKGVQTGGTLNVGVAMDVVSFDPPYTQDNGSLWADMNIYDQLVELTPTAEEARPRAGDQLEGQQRRQGLHLQSAEERALLQR